MIQKRPGGASHRDCWTFPWNCLISLRCFRRPKAGSRLTRFFRGGVSPFDLADACGCVERLLVSVRAKIALLAAHVPPPVVT